MKRGTIIVGVALFVSIFGTAIILNNTHNPLVTGTFSGTLDLDNGDEKINWSRFENFEIELKNETVNIVKSGVYHIVGSLTDQNITINVIDGKVKLILDGVTIQNSTGPAIYCQAADDLVIELKGENTLSDGKTYATSYDDDVNGVIYSKADLTFEGDGLLILTANYQDGIVGKDDVKFISGTYNITSLDDGIRGKDSVYVKGGNFTINAKGDGIKSTNETKVGKGFVLVEDGNIYIAKSVEGIEGKNIYITGGNLNITASDDGINISSNSGMLEFIGGKTYINASGDGVDSNGYIHFGGGTVTIDGPTNNGNGALDSNSGITQTGGMVVAVGASGMAESLGSTSSVYNVSIFFTTTESAGTKVEIKNASGETIISHTSAKTFSHMAAGSPEFKEGETYIIYVNGSKYDTFTISDKTTVVGENTSMGPGNMIPGGGEMPNGATPNNNGDTPPAMPNGNNRR